MLWHRQCGIASFRWLSLLVLLLCAFSSRGDEGKAAGVKECTHSFRAGGTKIRVRWFQPMAKGKHPVIVLLHTVNGVAKDLELYRAQGERYARQGMAVLLVHYFDRTRGAGGDLAAAQDYFRRFFQAETCPKGDLAKTMAQHFRNWKDTVTQAVAYARAQDHVDSKRIALAGVSLGACLALSVAGQEDLRIAAVAELFGCLPKNIHNHIRTMPPTLIIHGSLDKHVPVAQSHKLREFLNARKAPCELKVYEFGHCFEKAALVDILDVQSRLQAFFKKYLQPEISPLTPGCLCRKFEPGWEFRALFPHFNDCYWSGRG